MAKISYLWAVIDPRRGNRLVDFVWRQPVTELEIHMRGGESGWWKREHGAIHTTKESALNDAEHRLIARLPSSEREAIKVMFSPANIKREFG